MSQFKTGLIAFSTGLIEEPELPDDTVGGMAPIVPTTRVDDISLRDFAGPMLNQGDMNQCMQNALVTILDQQMRQSGHEIPALARMQSYWDTREAQGTINTDSGSVMEVTLNQAMSKGIAFENSWQYDKALLYTQPTPSVYSEAAQHKISSYTWMNKETSWNVMENGVKQALSEGKPVLLGFRADPWFFSATGPISQQPGTGPDTSGSGHAVAIIGVDENGTPDDELDDFAIIKNSWGTGWGDGGYGKINFREFNAYDHDIIDMYTINGFAGHDWTYTPQRNNVAELYVSLFNRAPDHTGMDWWASLGWTQSQLADEILTFPEAQALASASNAQFIDQIYTTVLDRAAGTDAEGRAFWTQALDSASRGSVLSEIITLTQGYVNGSNQQYDADAIHSKYFFNDRLEVAMHFGVAYESDNLDVARVALVGVNDVYQSVIDANGRVADLLGL